MSHVTVYDQWGQVVTPATVRPDADGVTRLRDAEGYGIAPCDWPPEFQAEPDEDEQAAAVLVLDAARTARIVRLARAVVASGHQACSDGHPIPRAMDQAIGDLDVALRDLGEPQEPAGLTEDELLEAWCDEHDREMTILEAARPAPLPVDDRPTGSATITWAEHCRRKYDQQESAIHGPDDTDWEYERDLRIDRLNATRTDPPMPRGISETELAMMAAGLAIG